MLCALCLWCLTANARAELPAVPVHISHCQENTEGVHEVVRLLRVELTPAELELNLIVESTPAPWDEPGLWLSWCGPRARIEILEAGKVASQQELELSDVHGDVLARTIAVALAELWTLRQQELARPPPPAPEAAAPPKPQIAQTAPPPDTAEQLPPRRELAVFAGAVMRAVLTQGSRLYGPSFGLRVGRFHLDIVALLTRTESVAGEVQLGIAGVAPAFDVWRVGRVPWFALRARGELGLTWAVVGNSGGLSMGRGLATMVGACAELALAAPLAPRWSLDIAGYAGYARGLITENDGRILGGTHGVAVGVRLGTSIVARTGR